jgi:hypothetical protein
MTVHFSLCEMILDVHPARTGEETVTPFWNISLIFILPQNTTRTITRSFRDNGLRFATNPIHLFH